ncbi:MAG: methionyl-tRNA formyltransferase [bacterium]|nr:methionyl-tRNA formyltransferase [bacterium]
MKNQQIKILFLGTPEFAVPLLEALIKAKYSILGVITGLDKPVGRKQILTPPSVKIAAEKHDLPVYQPQNKTELLEIMRKLHPDLAVVAAFGMIFSKEILEIPKYGFLNVHASLLPRWRGPSPIQAAILNGDAETGVTLMLINEKMDEGPTLANAELRIKNSELAAGELSKKLSDLGAELLIEILPKWLTGEIKSQEQDHSKATYCKIIKKEDGEIDWNKSAEYIERMTRAFWLWPSAYTFFKITNHKSQITNQIQNSKPKTILKIIKAEIAKENNHQIGEVFLSSNQKPAVRCGEGSLILELVQPEGKKPMTGEKFLKGHQKIIGLILGDLKTRF